MARIVEGTVSDKWDQVAGLLADHWEELAKNKSLMVLKPDRETYQNLERDGRIFALFAYDGDQIIGYSVNLITTHLHYADLSIASNDVLFVAQSHRTGRTGIQLIDRTEEVAQLYGAKLMLWHAKQNTDLEKIMPRLGYKVQEIMFSKEL
jgi:GNAT superfamily N-acetyltransferase